MNVKGAVLRILFLPVNPDRRAGLALRQVARLTPLESFLERANFGNLRGRLEDQLPHSKQLRPRLIWNCGKDLGDIRPLESPPRLDFP